MDMMTTTTPPNPNKCDPKMNMSLHWGTCEWVLVKTWKADTTGKFVFAAILVCLLTVAYEGLKFYRDYLLQKAQKTRAEKLRQSDAPLARSDGSRNYKQDLFNFHHVLQTFLHGIQIFISYMLMMIVMGANMNLIISICVGAAAGYFFFAWMKKDSCGDGGECCY